MFLEKAPKSLFLPLYIGYIAANEKGVVIKEFVSKHPNSSGNKIFVPIHDGVSKVLKKIPIIKIFT